MNHMISLVQINTNEFDGYRRKGKSERNTLGPSGFEDKPSRG